MGAARLGLDEASAEVVRGNSMPTPDTARLADAPGDPAAAKVRSFHPPAWLPLGPPAIRGALSKITTTRIEFFLRFVVWITADRSTES
jgi:hypothetical protein